MDIHSRLATSRRSLVARIAENRSAANRKQAAYFDTSLQ
jgi:hypothetical protein